MNTVFAETLAQIAIIAPAFLLAVSFHEFAHALIANVLGDNTAKRAGRLTLNPLKHIDLLGILFLLIFRVGWARPVPFNPLNFKRPRLFSMLTAVAGPISNFLLAYLFLYGVKYFPAELFSKAVEISFLQIFKASIYVNIMLGTLNLLPIPPLDGSRVLYEVLPFRLKIIYWTLQRYAILILILLIYLPATRMAFINSIVYIKGLLKTLVF